MGQFPRSVWLLGWVSLATDAASEAIYPLLPFFVVQVLGGSVVSLGVIEGAAEAINSTLKIASGWLADRSTSKRRLVLAGYTLSSAVRPLIAFAQNWTHVFTVRLVDRVGKGVRGAPRDAMLAGLATPETRGRIFGFHRAMDHAGAVLGPVLASGFLYFYPGDYRTLFALAIVPGAVAVALIFFVREDQHVVSAFPPTLAHEEASSGETRRSRWIEVAKAGRRTEDQHVVSASRRTTHDPRFRSFMIVLALFTLGNSTDAFLLLKLTEAAGSAQFVPLMWSALHVVKSAVSVFGGTWSDRAGRRKVMAAGWLVYALVYAGFSISSSLTTLFPLFLVYGIFFGLTEGTQKALVADLAPASRRGFAYGVYDAVLGFGSLAASVVFGLIWSAAGPAAAFAFGAVLALIATALLFVVLPARVQ